jgi:hypothetical protein
MVKMDKLVQKFENLFFRNKFLEKMVKQIISPKSALNYRSNQSLFAESHVISSPRAWELDESDKIHPVAGGASPQA